MCAGSCAASAPGVGLRVSYCRSMSAPARPTSAETNLYSEGAEFLVLGNLLIRGLHATKAYTRFPGWDILASDPTGGTTCRVQVKARLATDFDFGFPIKNFDAEFVVVVALNRGFRYAKARSARAGIGVLDPQFWVFPMEVVKTAAAGASTWGEGSGVYKIYFRRVIPEWESYEGAWHIIAARLGGSTVGADASIPTASDPG